MNAGFVHKRGRLYARGTSGARWCHGVRSGDDPPAGRPRRRSAPSLVAAVAAPARANPESDALRAKAADAHLQPRTRRRAGHVPAGRRRRSAGRRRLPRPRDVALAEHHVPPRQHDGGRLPGPPEQAERHPAARRRRPRRSPAFATRSTRRSRSRASAIAANPRDADAHYQLGAAVGLRASYTATVEGSVLGAFRAAREAYDEHEKVLSLAAAAQGCRPHRRHLPLHRRGAVAAGPVGRVRRGIRRRRERGHPA